MHFHHTLDMATEFSPLLQDKVRGAQVMRAGVRLMPLVPLHAGLLYEFETALSEDKLTAAEFRDQERRVFGLNQHLYEMAARGQKLRDINPKRALRVA
jgi:hypothetical protein